jgi:hypothetical protein
MSQVLNSCLLYMITLKEQLHRFAICWILILPFQTFLLIILSIQSNISSYKNNKIAEMIQNVLKLLMIDI